MGLNPDTTSFRSQVAFRMLIVEALLKLATEIPDILIDDPIMPKQRVSHINPEAIALPVHLHEWTEEKRRRTCAPCLGLRYGDRIFKRTALGEVAKDNNRASVRRQTSFGCKQCNIGICKEGGRECWDKFHYNR